jgi:PBSX family phage terminase large subunit
MSWQQTVQNNEARFKILRCGRRTGKTFFFVIDSGSLCLKYPNLSLAYVGLTYGHAKDVVWEDYIKLFGAVIEYTNSSELVLRFHNGSRIKLYSWDSIDGMLGKKYHKVYLDECAVATNLTHAWDNVVEPTLLDYRGEAWFASMPRGKGQFKKLIDDSQSKDDWQDFHFTSYDNSMIPDVKAELDRKRKDIAPSVFAQQYLAEFADLEGRIYTEFQRDDARPCPFIPERYGLSVDFGYNHPLAVYLHALSKDDKVHVLKELYVRKFDDEQRKKAINGLVEGYEISVAVADSEDPIAITQLNREINGVNFQPAIKGKGSVLSGINTVKSYFHKGDLTIDPTCVNLIDELEVYSWKINKSGEETDEPIKENDDACDSIRYFITKIATTQHFTMEDIVM